MRSHPRHLLPLSPWVALALGCAGATGGPVQRPATAHLEPSAVLVEVAALATDLIAAPDEDPATLVERYRSADDAETRGAIGRDLVRAHLAAIEGAAAERPARVAALEDAEAAREELAEEAREERARRREQARLEHASREHASREQARVDQESREREAAVRSDERRDHAEPARTQRARAEPASREEAPGGDGWGENDWGDDEDDGWDDSDARGEPCEGWDDCGDDSGWDEEWSDKGGHGVRRDRRARLNRLRRARERRRARARAGAPRRARAESAESAEPAEASPPPRSPRRGRSPRRARSRAASRDHAENSGAEPVAPAVDPSDDDSARARAALAELDRAIEVHRASLDRIADDGRRAGDRRLTAAAEFALVWSGWRTLRADLPAAARRFTEAHPDAAELLALVWMIRGDVAAREERPTESLAALRFGMNRIGEPVYAYSLWRSAAVLARTGDRAAREESLLALERAGCDVSAHPLTRRLAQEATAALGHGVRRDADGITRPDTCPVPRSAGDDAWRPEE